MNEPPIPADPPRINVSDLSLSSREYTLVQEVLDAGRFTQGPKVVAFEREFSRLVGVEQTVACNSGTSALHLALLALGVGPGDAVIVPALSYVATANAVRYVGADGGAVGGQFGCLASEPVLVARLHGAPG